MLKEFQSPSLKVQAESMKIGEIHRTVIKQTLNELEDDIQKKAAHFSQLSEEYRARHGLDEDDQHYAQYHNQLQDELEMVYNKHQTTLTRMYDRFQREWARDPRIPDAAPDMIPHGTQSMYLTVTLGLALQKGLAEVVQKRPDDPIEYLANWLKKHSTNCEFEHRRAKERHMVSLEREEMNSEKEADMMRKREMLLMKKEEERRKVMYVSAAVQAEEKTNITTQDQVDFTSKEQFEGIKESTHVDNVDRNTDPRDTDTNDHVLLSKSELFTILENEQSEENSDPGTNLMVQS